MLDPTDRDPRFAGHCVEVGEVGDPRVSEHRDVDRIATRCICSTPAPDRARRERERVLGVDCHAVEPRDDTEGRHAGALLELARPGAEKGRIPPELVDDEPAHATTQVAREQLDGAEQVGEHATPVDVADHHGGNPCRIGESEVDQVRIHQVDLGRASGTLQDDDVEAPPDPRQRVEHRVAELGLGPLEVGGVERLPRAAHHDHLASPLADRLQQDRVHGDVRLDAGRLGLGPLGSDPSITVATLRVRAPSSRANPSGPGTAIRM